MSTTNRIVRARVLSANEPIMNTVTVGRQPILTRPFQFNGPVGTCCVGCGSFLSASYGLGKYFRTIFSKPPLVISSPSKSGSGESAKQRKQSSCNCNNYLHGFNSCNGSKIIAVYSQVCVEYQLGLRPTNSVRAFAAVFRSLEFRVINWIIIHIAIHHLV